MSARLKLCAIAIAVAVAVAVGVGVGVGVDMSPADAMCPRLYPERFFQFGSLGLRQACIRKDGANGSQGAGGQKSMARAQFDALDPAAKAAPVTSTDAVTITD